MRRGSRAARPGALIPVGRGAHGLLLAGLRRDGAAPGSQREWHSVQVPSAKGSAARARAHTHAISLTMSSRECMLEMGVSH